MFMELYLKSIYKLNYLQLSTLNVTIFHMLQL